MSTDKCSADQIALKDNFNVQSKCAVFYRNLDRNVGEETILIKQEGDKYLVHEDNGFLETVFGDEGYGKLKWYNEEEFQEKYGETEIRDYQQYKADADLLRSTPGLGRNLDEAKETMKYRLEEIQQDMKDANQSFAPKADLTTIKPEGLH